MTTLKQTPSQTVGPYFAYGLCPQQYDYDLKSLFTPTIAAARRRRTRAAGRGVRRQQRRRRRGARVHAGGRRGPLPTSRDDIAKSGFTGFARVGTGTDAQQRFVVETVKPGRLAADEAPHINVTVMMRGILTRIHARVLRRRSRRERSRPVLNAVPAERRATRRETRRAAGPPGRLPLRHPMQGPDETVFFDV